MDTVTVVDSEGSALLLLKWTLTGRVFGTSIFDVPVTAAGEVRVSGAAP